ncbi:MAG: zinc ribbon domain-containing protein, partial [Acidobacteriota bacterium]
ELDRGGTPTPTAVPTPLVKPASAAGDRGPFGPGATLAVGRALSSDIDAVTLVAAAVIVTTAVCRQCGTENDADARFCKTCGTQIA